MGDTTSSTPRSDRPVTILDVARASGVSKSTVSRILDERAPSISPNAAKVRETAQRLGYKRNLFASALRQRRTNTVGVVVPRLTDTTMAIFFEAVSQLCARQGRLAIVATAGHAAGGSQQAVETLLERHVDGLILATDRSRDGTVQNLRDRDIEHVCALRSEGLSPAALGNDQLGGYLAARHLLDLGHTEIAMVNGPRFASNARGREAGFLEALTEVGLRPTHISKTDFTTQTGAEAATQIIKSPTRFTALFAATDNLAIGAMSALTQAGLSVPQDVSVVGYNDIPLARHLPTPLTSVRVPFDEIASNALSILERSPSTPEQLISTPTLISRGSTRRM